MLRIFNSVRFGDFNEFDDGVKNVFGVVCVLIEFVVQVGCKKNFRINVNSGKIFLLFF